MHQHKNIQQGATTYHAIKQQYFLSVGKERTLHYLIKKTQLVCKLK